MPDTPTDLDVKRGDSTASTAASLGPANPLSTVRKRKLTYRHRQSSNMPAPQVCVDDTAERPVAIQTQRIDTAHVSPPNAVEVNQLPHDQPTHNQPTHDQHEASSIDRDAWLRLHADELIRRLQLWATGLDAREAHLNAAYAQQDLRERKFRLQQMDFQNEMSEARRSVEQLRTQVDAQSRRLAFESLA